MVHMCINFHSQWTHIAGTCFTMLSTDQKIKLDDALTWVMGFGSNLVWWSYLVVGTCSKSFHGHWVYQTCTCFTMPLCCIQTLGISFGSLARQMVVQIG